MNDCSLDVALTPVTTTAQEQQCAAAAGWRCATVPPSAVSNGSPTGVGHCKPRESAAARGPELQPHTARGQPRQRQDPEQQLGCRDGSSAGQACRGDASCHTTVLAPRAISRADSQYIVRFRDYRPAEEHQQALLEHLSPAAAQLPHAAESNDSQWRWVTRQNKAAAFPTDFGLLAITGNVEALTVRRDPDLDSVLSTCYLSHPW
jgi:hypothetical protein